MSARPATAAIEAALVFLNGVKADDAEGLTASIDYPALAVLATARGFKTDARAIELAFRILMRMRNATQRALRRP